MKKTLLTCAALLMLGCVSAQTTDAVGVIRKTREKCQSIQGGHYEMEWRKKFMARKDTIVSHYSCHFKKVPGDTLCGMVFSLFDKTYEYQALYTGNEYVGISADSTGEVVSCSQWPDVVKNKVQSRVFYTPLTNRKCYPIPAEEDIDDSNVVETSLGGKQCYRVCRSSDMDIEVMPGNRVIRYEVNVWIDKKDYMPIQYSILYVNVERRDTMYQYEECRLLSFNPEVDESRLTLESVPSYVTLSDYVPYTPPEPFADGTPAPDWTLPSLTGDIVRLADLRGKVVLVDFFYKSCAPCCAALPGLQRLHEKYKDHGFTMVGIDPIDDPAKDEMADFLSKRDITYTVLFSDRELPNAYRVSGYPTLFLIDREGNIVKTFKGYSKEMESKIEEVLLKML